MHPCVNIFLMGSFNFAAMKVKEQYIHECVCSDKIVILSLPLYCSASVRY